MKRLLFLFITVLSFRAEARLQRFGFDGVRQTGMGNTGIALADDLNCLWYNPAGLADIKRIHVNLFDFTLGADSMDSFNRLKNAIFKSDFQNLIRPDSEFLRFNIAPQVAMPYFSFSFFENLQGFFDLGNLQTLDDTKDIQALAFNDVGLIAGIAIPFGEYFSIGGAARFFQRTGIDTNVSVGDFVSGATSKDEVVANLYQYMKDLAGAGVGIGGNAGALLKIPLSGKDAPIWKVGATVEDIGNTTFTKVSGVLNPPNRIKQTLNFGTALQWKTPKKVTWNNELDYRDFMDNSAVFRHVHFGSELRWSWLGVRAGVSQGYYTAGLSLETPPHTRIHFSTYGVEVGEGSHDREQRWYLLQLIIGFNPF